MICEPLNKDPSSTFHYREEQIAKRNETFEDQFSSVFRQRKRGALFPTFPAPPSRV
jgi:hypothetical protein